MTVARFCIAGKCWMILVSTIREFLRIEYFIARSVSF